MLTCGQIPGEVYLEKPINQWVYIIYYDIFILLHCQYNRTMYS